MPQNINQPSNRISLTNISLVRLKKGKKRFEIACYKNKLLEYRSGLETDLDNVLQVPTIFLNVSKGQTAPKDDLQKAFGKGVSNDEIIVEILKRGEVQVGANERKELLDRIEREVVELVSERVVDPETKRVYTTGMIRKALDLLSKQAGHAQQGIEVSKPLTTEEDDDNGGMAGQEEEQAGYMGLGKLDLEDDEENNKRTQKGHGGKKSKKSGGGAGGGGAKNNKKKTTAAEKTPEDGSDPEPFFPQPSQPPPNTTDTTNDLPPSSQTPTWTGVSTTKPPKALALEAMKALIYHQPIPIQRARMRLRLTIPSSLAKSSIKQHKPDTSSSTTPTSTTTTTITLKEKVLSYIEQIESLSTAAESGDWEVLGFVEPGSYKPLAEVVSGETRGRGRLEVLDMAVVHED